MSEPATAHFEKPVDTTHFKDYPNYVECPMDLETIDGKIDRDEYATPEGNLLLFCYIGQRIPRL